MAIASLVAEIAQIQTPEARTGKLASEPLLITPIDDYRKDRGDGGRPRKGSNDGKGL